MRAVFFRFGGLLALGLAAACTSRPEAPAGSPVAEATAAPAAPPAATAPVAAAPDCRQPFGLCDGTELTYRLTNEKNKLEGVQVLKVARISQHAAEKKSPAYAEALLKSSLYDASNRLLRNDEFVYLCRNDTVLTDGRLLLDPALLSSFRDRRFAYEPQHLPWPNQPVAGPLPGGRLIVQVSSPSTDIARVVTTVSQRQVSGPVATTTPAGTFQCYKVEARYEYATELRPDLTRRTVKRVTDYYAPGTGLVRTEMRDADGELDRVAELVKLAAGSR
ncbi:hypothetical protein [Hymenobacter sp. B81]|uniref:TapB family protein n=1 Tax=Hymenobacter sp. B81 TaxID=3344878 RepID=UPI0037DCBDB1